MIAQSGLGSPLPSLRVQRKDDGQQVDKTALSCQRSVLFLCCKFQNATGQNHPVAFFMVPGGLVQLPGGEKISYAYMCGAEGV